MKRAAPTVSIPTSTATKAEFCAEVDAGIEYLQENAAAIRNRCIDTLLDLYNLCTASTVRASIACALEEIDRGASVQPERLIASLRMVATVADVDGGFDRAA